MDNRVFILGWNMGRTEEVPSWRPYEDDRPVEAQECGEPAELPFDL